MFDKLIEFLLNFLDLWRFWTVAKDGNRVVIYTLGRVTRVVGPRDGIFNSGLHPKAPFWLETDEETSVRDEWISSTTIDGTTSDKEKVHLRGTFKVAILPEKVAEFQVLLGDEDRTLNNCLTSAITETVARRPLAELFDPEELKDYRQEVLRRAREELREYGYKVSDFKWCERVSVRTYRFITGE